MFLYFPLVIATTSVFSDTLGVGISRSAVMVSLLPSILAVIYMKASIVEVVEIIPEMSPSVTLLRIISGELG